VILIPFRPKRLWTSQRNKKVVKGDMTRKSCFKIIAATIFVAVILWGASTVLIPRLLDLDSYKPQILSLLDKSLQRPVSYESASFSGTLIPSIVFNKIVVKEKTGNTSLLTVDRLTFRLALLPLLHKEVRLREVVLEQPVFVIGRDQAGVFSFSDLFSGPPSAYNVHINDVQIRNGRIRFTDQIHAGEVITTSLEGLDLQVHGLTSGDTSEFKFSTAITNQAGRADLSVTGKAVIPARDVSFTKTRLDVDVSAKNLDAASYWPYYGRFLPFDRIQGVLDLQGALKGTLEEFASKGSLSVRGLRLNYPQVFPSLITPKTIDLRYDMAFTPGNLTVKSLDVKVDGLQVKGSLALKDMHSKDPHLTARVVSSPFSLEEFQGYIPYGIIPKGTADFIEQHVKGGIFRVDEGRLEGRISQILHMERGTNYDALHVRATVDKGVMTFGEQIPKITAIKGGLEFRGKDFILSGMAGNFGGSPFTLDGKIADYPLNTPANYPFTMSMTPAQAEVAWLIRQEKPGQLNFSGPSILRLSGSGIAADYKLSGLWDLTGAGYRFPQMLHKSAGLTNRIRFSASLTSAEARLTELHYELPQLDVTASAVYLYGNIRPLSLTAVSNQFDIAAVVPVIPGIDSYHPAGRLQATIGASGDPAVPDSLEWKGSVSVADLSVRPSERISPLKHINGTVNVSGTDFDTKDLSGVLGNSSFTAKGRVSGLSRPVAELELSSPILHLADLGLRKPGEDPAMKNLSAVFTLKDGNLAITSLAGQLNSSSFQIQGDLLDIRNPDISLRVNFPFLRVEDFEALGGLKYAGADREKAGELSLKLGVTAAAGSVRGISFAKLDSKVLLKGDQLAVTALSVTAFGGTVSGSGTVELNSSGGPFYQARYRLERVDAAQLSKVAGVERSITGLLTADGDLKMQGSNPEVLKRSVSGTVRRLRLQDGLLPNPVGSGDAIPCDVLDASLSFNKESIIVQGLKAGLFGGAVSGSGKIDLASAGGPMYQAQYRLEGVDAALLAKTAGLERNIAGKLTVDGKLTAQGNSLERLKETGRGSAEIELNDGALDVSMKTERGPVQHVPFKTVKGHLVYEKDVLTVTSARVDVFDGVVSGTGTADLTDPHKPGYRISFTSRSIDADKLDQAFGFKSDISGRMDVKGELSTSGEGQEGLSKALQGSLDMRMERGTINKFTFLSKVFSILNVSQLFSLRLPNMVSTGMPYDSITGGFVVTDGVVSTSDLSIKSPAINMNIVGNSDLVKKNLELTVAVQPLQTISMIVSRIPVIGWLLTGGDRSFLVSFYKVKGSWGDPTVSSANISELPQGIFNVFKRTFSLPEKMITNTGDVFMGN